MFPRWPLLRIAICGLLFLVIFRLMFSRRDEEPASSEQREIPVENSGFLQAFEDNDELLKYSNIYFIESSAPFRSVVSIDSRQACAIEAAARANPHKNVIVLLASWTDFTEADRLNVLDHDTLKRFHNVYFRWLDLEHFALGTPVDSVIKSDSLYGRSDGVEALSEILRMVLLYKYGGIYLDLDVVTLKPLEFFHPNFFGAQSSELADPSIMGLERGGYGQIWAKDYLEYIEYFHTHNETRSASTLLTNKLLQACEKVTVQEIVDEGCFGRLEVFSSNLFHPFDETNVQAMFDPAKQDMVKIMTADSMAVHMHNHMSRGLKLEYTGETGYELIARNNCPNVYTTNDEGF